MRVLVVCSGNSRNDGLDLARDKPFVWEQAEAVRASGVDVDVFAIRGKGVRGYAAHVRPLRKAVATGRYDVVHAHSGISACVAVLQRAVPVVVTFHGSDVNNRSTRPLSMIAAWGAAWRIFVSGRLRDALPIVGRQRTSVVPCGVDFDVFVPMSKGQARARLGLDASGRYVLFASRFDRPVKNAALALEALKRVPNATLIELAGYTREEVVLLLNACDVLLLTSFSEGSPQVVKEALACNCPVISTDVGDVRDMLSQAGMCYVTGYDAGEIAAAIEEVLSSGKRSDGRSVVTRFDQRHVAQRILSIYERVTTRREAVPADPGQME